MPAPPARQPSGPPLIFGTRLQLDAALRYDRRHRGKRCRYRQLRRGRPATRLGSIYPAWNCRIIGQNLLDNHHPEFLPDFINTRPTEVERSIYGRVTWSFLGMIPMTSFPANKLLYTRPACSRTPHAAVCRHCSCCCMPVDTWQSADEAQQTEYRIKTAFLYNFARFVSLAGSSHCRSAANFPAVHPGRTPGLKSSWIPLPEKPCTARRSW